MLLFKIVKSFSVLYLFSFFFRALRFHCAAQAMSVKKYTPSPNQCILSLFDIDEKRLHLVHDIMKQFIN